MSGSVKGLSLNLALLGGSLTSSQLESELSTPYNLGAFRKMLGISFVRRQLLNDPSILNIIFNSDKAATALLSDFDALNYIATSDNIINTIVSNPTALKAMLTNDTAFFNVKNSSLYAKIQAKVNVSGSKLKRQIFTSSGTFTIPISGLAACTVFLVGSGGATTAGGIGGVGGYGPGGGGGGETKVFKFTTMPSSNVAVTVSTTSSFGGFAIAAAGSSSINAAVFPNGGTGGGSTSGTVPLSVDYSPTTAAWQPNNYSVKGGDGGSGEMLATSTARTVGGSGWYGTSALGVTSTGFGMGGSGGTATSSGSAPTTTATYGNGCTPTTSTTGGPGSAGIVIVYYIEN